MPPYRVLDPVSPQEGGNVTICALENSIVAVIPRAFLHSSELEKEADKVERRRQRYALNQATLNQPSGGTPFQKTNSRKSHQITLANTLSQVMMAAKKKTSAQTAHEKVQSSQEMLKKKLLASTLQATVCRPLDLGAPTRLPETPEDVQDLFPNLSLQQAEKVFEELAPDNAKIWRTAQDRKKGDGERSTGQNPLGSKSVPATSWQKMRLGFKRASSAISLTREEASIRNSLSPEVAEFEKITEHWDNIRVGMGISPVIKANKRPASFLFGADMNRVPEKEQEDAKDSEDEVWKSEPIFVKAIDAGGIGTQSAVDGSLQEFLSRVPSFRILKENHAADGRSWEQVYNMFTVKRVPEGTCLLEEGELTDRIILIMAGEVEVSSTVLFRESSCRPRNILIREKQTDVGETDVAFRILGPGDCLGHFKPAEQPYRSAITATARTACRVCRSSAASTCARIFLHLLEGGGQMMEDLHASAMNWIPSQHDLRKIMIQQRQWAAFKDRTVQAVVANPINRTAQTAFLRAPGAQAWLQGGEADAYRGDVGTINLAEGGPASIRGGRPTSATLARQVKDVRSTTALVPYACRLRDKSPVHGADLAKRSCGHCPMVTLRNKAALDGSTRPSSAPGGLRRSASVPGKS
jgi:CRP-like cAMP-binding protein